MLKNQHPLVLGMIGAAIFLVVLKFLPANIAGFFRYDPSSGAYTLDPETIGQASPELIAQVEAQATEKSEKGRAARIIAGILRRKA